MFKEKIQLKHYLLIALFASGVLLTKKSEASLLLYEGFNYTSGSNLNGANSGTGFTSAWSLQYAGTGSTASVTSSGLNSAMSPSSSGNAILESNSSTNYSAYYSRSMSSTVFQNMSVGNKMYTSFLTSLTNTSGMMLYFDLGGSSIFGMAYTGSNIPGGNSTGQNLVSLGLGDSNNPTINTVNYNAPTGTSMWEIILTLNSRTGTAGNYTANFTAELYNVLSTSSSTLVTTINNISVAGYGSTSNTYNANLSLKNATFDELRAGTTAADAVKAVPEPSTLAVLALGTLGILRKKRNIKK